MTSSHPVNSYINNARHTREIYQILPYSMDFKALRELWNPLGKTVFSKCSFSWNKRLVTSDITVAIESKVYVEPVNICPNFLHWFKSMWYIHIRSIINIHQSYRRFHTQLKLLILYNILIFHIVIAVSSWWRHQMEIFSALLALCVGNSPVTGEFPSWRPVARSFDVFFDLRLE